MNSISVGNFLSIPDSLHEVIGSFAQKVSHLVQVDLRIGGQLGVASFHEILVGLEVDSHNQWIGSRETI